SCAHWNASAYFYGIRAVMGSQFCSKWWQFGAPEEIRTPDPQIRRLVSNSGWRRLFLARPLFATIWQLASATSASSAGRRHTLAAARHRPARVLVHSVCCNIVATAAAAKKFAPANRLKTLAIPA
ncbi:hypothetical protein, partial [Bradyrhizobium sp.]|uniref:hypothetical protein n=1 Tax=Bradyrhizobium sp. TaxID=376 RepID=UPI003C7684A8